MLKFIENFTIAPHEHLSIESSNQKTHVAQP